MFLQLAYGLNGPSYHLLYMLLCPPVFWGSSSIFVAYVWLSQVDYVTTTTAAAAAAADDDDDDIDDDYDDDDDNDDDDDDDDDGWWWWRWW